MPKRFGPLAYTLPLVGFLPLLLAACGEPDPAKLNSRIDDGDYAGALDKLGKAIESSPTSPVYHLLAVRATLLRCAHEEGACQNMSGLNKHLDYTAAPVRIAERPMSLGGVLDESLPAMAHLPSQPQAWLDLLKSFPANRRDVLTNSLFGTAGTLLVAGEVSSSSALLTSMANLPADVLPDSLRSWAGAMGYTLSDDQNLKGGYFIALKSQKTPPLPPAAAALAPGVVWFDSVSADTSGTLTFVQNLSPTLAGWGSPLLQDPAAANGIADGLNRMRTNEAFLSRALAAWPTGGSVVTGLSPSVPLTDGGVALQLALSKLSLMYNPNQPALLSEYVNLANEVMDKTGRTDLISDISFERLPEAAQGALVEKLFGVLEAQQAANRPLGPVLMPLANLKLDKTNTTRLEKLLQTALEQAVANKQAQVAMAIANTRPTLAQNNRQIIAPLLVDDIRAHLKARDFGTVTEVGNFLNSKLGVSFNLDALILEGLSEDLKTVDAVKNLSANDPTWLLRRQEDAAFDLGPYWRFVQEHFAGKPEVLNNQLRALVASAGGAYGPATAMWRLDKEFEDSEFGPNQRTAYTNKAIQSALLADTSLAPGALLELTGRLAVVHPNLPLAPVVAAALSRATTLDDSRAIWNAASPTAREVITSVRPQFASLMRGVDAFNSHRLTAAAAEFSRITDGSYRDQLLPYFDELQARLAGVTGVYVNSDPLSKLPTAYVIVDAPSLRDGGDKSRLNELTVTLVNRLGTLTEADEASLGSNSAVVKAVPLTATLDFNSNSALLANALAAPSNVSKPLNELFGPIQALVFVPAGKGKSASLGVHLAGVEQPVMLERVQANPNAVLLPQGKFLMNTPVTSATALLPPGLVLETMTESVGSGSDNGAYALQARLRHPGLNTPQDLDGRYDSLTHTFTTTFKAPLKQGNVPAGLKCQVLGRGLVCGAHYLNQMRQAYASRIAGEATRESVAAQAVRLQASDDAYLNSLRGGSNPLMQRLKATEPVRTEAASTRLLSDIVSMTATPVSGTAVSKTDKVLTPAPVSGSAAVSDTEQPISISPPHAAHKVSDTGPVAPQAASSMSPQAASPAASEGKIAAPAPQAAPR